MDDMDDMDDMALEVEWELRQLARDTAAIIVGSDKQIAKNLAEHNFYWRAKHLVACKEAKAALDDALKVLTRSGYHGKGPVLR